MVEESKQKSTGTLQQKHATASTSTVTIDLRDQPLVCCAKKHMPIACLYCNANTTSMLVIQQQSLRLILGVTSVVYSCPSPNRLYQSWLYESICSGRLCISAIYACHSPLQQRQCHLGACHTAAAIQVGIVCRTNCRTALNYQISNAKAV